MMSLRSILLAGLLALAPAAAAQDAIEKQMAPEEFKAAGIDKLSVDELARLNARARRCSAFNSAVPTASAAGDGSTGVSKRVPDADSFVRDRHIAHAASPRAGHDRQPLPRPDG